MTADVAAIVPELFLVLAAMALLMVGVFRGRDATGLVVSLAVVAVVALIRLTTHATGKGRLVRRINTAPSCDSLV